MLDLNMAKLGGVVVSLLNAVVLGVVAYRSKSPKTWTLQANMPWLQTRTWDKRYPQPELVENLLKLDQMLLQIASPPSTQAPPDPSRLLTGLKAPIAQRVGRITDPTEHIKYMDMATTCFAMQDLDTRKFICAWFLVRGASCLQGFGETTSTQEMKRRVRLVLGRSFDEPNQVFSEPQRTSGTKVTVVPRNDEFYDLTNEVLYEDSDSWPRTVDCK
jgi:hypothetical protein